MSEATWQNFALDGLGVRFRYPTTTPTGHAVEMDDFRAHFRSPDSAEVYFELSRHLHPSAQEFYAREREFLLRQLPDAAVGDLTATTVGGASAHRFTVRWAMGERVMLLIERAPGLYRIVYDPRSPLNEQVLATLVWE
jgi:hypothetical protein